MSLCTLSLAVGLWAPWAALQQPPATAGLERLQRYEVPFALAEWEAVGELAEGEGTPTRLLLVGVEGAVRLVLGDGAGRLDGELVGALELEHPARSLLDVGPWLGAQEPPCLVIASPAGTQLVRLNPADLAQGALSTLARRARFDLRVGAPRFAPLLQDVDQDGQLDLVLPAPDAAELWLRETDGDEQLLVRSARVRVDATTSLGADSEQLSDRLSASFSIPGLVTADVNGSGRPDLIVVDGARHAFHLQRDGGGFSLEPDVEVDLERFRDTGAEAGGFRLGGTLSLQQQAQLTRRDLDGDGRADFVIAHGRKVWVFHGGPEGPQFREPSAILKTADDVTALAIVHLDDDEFPDLLLLRVEVPSAPALLLGMISSWDIRVRATGYRNLDGRSFELRPSYTSDLALRLPPILELLKDPYTIFESFQRAGSRFRTVLEGDLDGDGNRDLALVQRDERRVEIWLGRAGASGQPTRAEAERMLRDQLFGQRESVWDIERLLGWVEGMAGQWEERLTEGRAPDLVANLGLPPGATLGRIEILRPAGADADRLLIGWQRPDGRAGFDLVRWAR